MTPQSNTLIKIKRWLFGALLSTAAMFLGYNLGSGTAGLLGGEPGIWARMGKGLVWGLVLAGPQSPIARAVGVFPVRFFAASAAGAAIGYPFRQTIRANMNGLNWMWGYGSALAVYGLSLGTPQWWIFRRHMQPASLWILFGEKGWMLTDG